MNKSITSKESILKSAKRIAYRDGIYKLSIRALAAECRVSVGSIYNYFSNKDDLVAAVIEDFWRSIFEKGMCNHQSNLCFIQFYEQLYIRFYDYLKIFKEDMINQNSFLNNNGKENSSCKEFKYLEKMKSIMLYHLSIDKDIKQDIWSDNFTKEKFVEFVFQNMIIMLKSNKEDISFLKELIIKLLY